MRKTHKLKTLTEHFSNVVAGLKLAEVRNNDRDFKNGDYLILQEFDGKKLTGNEHLAIITHVLKGGEYGIEDDHVVLSITPVKEDPRVISRVTGGWYQWQPHEDCKIAWLDMEQIIQVIESEVWSTGISATVSVKAAKKSGTFVRRINLNEK